MNKMYLAHPIFVQVTCSVERFLVQSGSDGQPFAREEMFKDEIGTFVVSLWTHLFQNETFRLPFIHLFTPATQRTNSTERTDRTGRKLNDEWPVSRGCVSHLLCLVASLPLAGFRRKLHFLFLAFQSNLYVIHFINHLKNFHPFLIRSDDAICRVNEESNSTTSSAIIKML